MQDAASPESEDDIATGTDGDAVYALTPGFVHAVIDALDAGDEEALTDLVTPLHAADMADLLGLLRGRQRYQLLDILGARLNPEVLPNLDESLRDKVVAALPAQVLASAIAALETDDSVYLLENLSEERKAEILDLLSNVDRAPVEKGLSYPEDTAGRLMRSELVAVPPFWTVGQTIDYMRTVEGLPDQFYEIFIVDPTFHPIGTVPLSRVACSRRPVLIGDLMDEEQTLIPVLLDQEEVAFLFDRYSLVSAAVVDENERLVGVVTVDDVVNVISEEAEEDILKLGGVQEAELSDTVLTATRRRFPWLLVNLFTAIIASLVIAQFEATLEQIVALAILMPIVASMGGNAGTQTLTVAVRAIATKELNPANAFRVIVREVFVGGNNGLLFALLMGVTGWIWFGDPALGAVLAIAMVINMLAAGLAGILAPLALDKLNLDPAMASGVVVTTVTDVVGFFAFLGLAALILL